MSAGSPSRINARRLASWVLLVASVVFVVLILLRDREAFASLQRVGVGSLAVLALAQIIYLVLQSYRQWIVLLRCGGERVPFGYWLRIFVIGRVLNSLLPQAGNVYRGVRLKRDHRVTYTEYVTLFFAFTWLATIFNLALAAVVLAVFKADVEVAGVNGVVAVVALLVALIAAPFVLRAITALSPGRAHWVAWTRERLLQLFDGSIELLRHRRLLVELAVSGVAALLLVSGIFWIVFQALDVDTSLAEVVLLYVLLQTSTYVNLTPGNLGVQEAIFGILSSQVGFAAATGVLVSAIVRATGYVALAVVAVAVGGRELRAALRSARERDAVQN
jgi:uncharacterized membrane protein YbhN (UPF0104 family)